MKKLLALVIALLVIGGTGMAVMAQDDTVGKQVTSRVKTRIHTTGAFGNGLAVSGDDPMDFELLKVGIVAIFQHKSAGIALIFYLTFLCIIC